MFAQITAFWHFISSIISTGLRVCLRPHNLAFIPAVSLAIFWIGGEIALIALAFLVPFLWIATQAYHSQDDADLASHMPTKKRLMRHINAGLTTRMETRKNAAVFFVDLDHLTDIETRHGVDAVEQVMKTSCDRLQSVIRGEDMIATLDQNKISVSIAPKTRFDLETAIQLAGRFQTIIQEPISLNAGQIYVSASIGFCLSSRSPARTATALFDAAYDAMVEARRNGPSAIRAFSPDLIKSRDDRNAMIGNVEDALEQGQIRAWFQPQISTDTGQITGFESLARWCHPAKGMIPPLEFLDAIEDAGLMERLGEVMLFNALSAHKTWEEHGIRIPTIGVNFSVHELRNPKLVEKIQWELERFNLAPNRLTVEVLESVMAGGSDDIITRNVARLAELGCGIDLDDFGTGHASITNIRRLAVGRIKIDRSFVMKVDKDPEQQKLVSAILLMGEQLGLDTLAEGVETQGEHAMLAQLGCGHVQGFGLAKPMPLDDTVNWIRTHNAQLDTIPATSQRVG